MTKKLIGTSVLILYSKFTPVLTDRAYPGISPDSGVFLDWTVTSLVFSTVLLSSCPQASLIMQL